MYVYIYRGVYISIPKCGSYVATVSTKLDFISMTST